VLPTEIVLYNGGMEFYYLKLALKNGRRESDMRKPALFLGILIVLILASPAYAYIGPGLGTGAIAAVFGVLASIFLAFLSILWYPFKRFLRRHKKSVILEPDKNNHVSNDLGSDRRA